MKEPGQRTKILFLNHTARISGAEKSLLEMLRALRPFPYDPIVGLPEEDGDLGRILRNEGIETIRFHMRRITRTCNPLRLVGHLANIVATASAMRTFIRSRTIALVHSNSNTANLYGSVAATLAGIPAVWHCRDLVNLGVMGRIMYRLSSRVVSISSCVHQHVLQYGGDPSKVRTIHNCIDAEAFTATTRPSSPQTPSPAKADGFLVVMISQLVPWKNHRLLIDAADIVAKQTDGVRVVIAGDDVFGDQSRYVANLKRAIEERSLSGSVTFAGHVEDTAALLSKADLLVHPAVHEPFGRVILEAMAAGVPVVAVDACGPAEIIRNGLDGTLVPPEPAAFAGAILDALRTPSRALALARSASVRVRKDFCPHVFAQKMTAVYREIL